jgi:hypothetical protein
VQQHVVVDNEAYCLSDGIDVLLDLVTQQLAQQVRLVERIRRWRSRVRPALRPFGVSLV